MINSELHTEVLDILKQKYNILFGLDCRDFDLNYEILVEKLQDYTDYTFSNNDKILITHMDTDYYDSLLNCGLIPINITRTFERLDIPYHALLVVTNHFGIKKEFDALLQNKHKTDRPTIINTLLSKTLMGENYSNLNNDIQVDKIEKQGLCMMGKQRSHRVFLYNFLKNKNIDKKIAVSQNFNE